MSRARVYERDTDALFIRTLRESETFAYAFSELALKQRPAGTFKIEGQVQHIIDPGSIDFVIRFQTGPVLLIENKIDASYSITRAGDGQPQRYQRSVASLRSSGQEAISVLLAPKIYLDGSRLGDLFDVQISYEDLRKLFNNADLGLLEAAILQAQAPYEPIANIGAGEFFSAIRHLILEQFPDLKMKDGPNPDGVRPDNSRTIYFNVPRTLVMHEGVSRPRMSLQCWDKAAHSASVKIMLPDRALLARNLMVPSSLADIGGYLRPAGRSLGITIDTPHLHTQRSLAEQADDIAEALEAALRLQLWWNENALILREWSAGRPG